MAPRRRLPLLLALLAGCSLEAPAQYLVPDLRILAIRSTVVGTTTVADADVGEAVTLEALVANPLGRAPPTVTWYGCPPGLVQSPCSDPAWLRDPDRFAAATPADPVLLLGSGVAITVSLAALEAGLSAALVPYLDAAAGNPALQCQLYAELPLVAIAASEGVVEVATKHVRITPTTQIATDYPTLVGKYVVNLNPAVGALQADPTDPGGCAGGTSLSTPCAGPADCGGGPCALDGYCDGPLPAGELALCARIDPAVSQAFLQCEFDGTQTLLPEELSWQWYVSSGEFAQAGFGGNVTGNQVDLKPVPGPFRLWAIIRDGRGGTGWLVRDLVAP